MKLVKIAVLADLHYSAGARQSGRRGDLAAILLLRTVRRLNQFVKPDLTVVLGDLVDDGRTPAAAAALTELRAILERLQSPWAVIPGNHDGDSDWFYRVMPRPPPWLDAAGWRFVPLLDEERPAFNAFRPPAMMDRVLRARAGFQGPLAVFQHIPLHPPGAVDCPFNLVNAARAIAVMQKAGVRLSLGGHYHKGFDLLTTDKLSFLSVPALCEAPFPFYLVTLAANRVEVERQMLGMPPKLELFDHHVHTPWAYCNENMDLKKSVELAEAFGLAGLAFVEHSSHLFFDRARLAAGAHFQATPQSLAKVKNRRVDDCFAAIRKLRSSRVTPGLEIDCNDWGAPVVRRSDLARFRFKIGAVHSFPALRANAAPAKVHDEFLAILEKFVQTGIQTLAHPFRSLFHWEKRHHEPLFKPVCKLLRANGVAAELNFHSNEPPPRFFKMCIENGVKLTLGSDAHNLCEVGEFAPHLAMLAGMGYNSGRDGFLYSAAHKRARRGA